MISSSTTNPDPIFAALLSRAPCHLLRTLIPSFRRWPLSYLISFVYSSSATYNSQEKSYLFAPRHSPPQQYPSPSLFTTVIAISVAATVSVLVFSVYILSYELGDMRLMVDSRLSSMDLVRREVGTDRRGEDAVKLSVRLRVRMLFVRYLVSRDEHEASGKLFGLC